VYVDTRNTERLSGEREDYYYEERGFGSWIRRNPWLLSRLFIVIVFSFAASTVAANFSYGLEGKPTVLSVDQLNAASCRRAPKLGDYVQVSGTPNVGENLGRVGVPESEVAVVGRYSTHYFYFRLAETETTSSSRPRRVSRKT
jgi:hypothetical protein